MSDVILYELSGYMILLWMTSDLVQDRYTITFRVCPDSGACLLPGVMKFRSCLIFPWLGFRSSWLGKLNTHITQIIVSELPRYISCETALCFLRDLSVTIKWHWACSLCSAPLHIALKALVSYSMLNVTRLELFFAGWFVRLTYNFEQDFYVCFVYTLLFWYLSNLYRFMKLGILYCFLCSLDILVHDFDVFYN